MPNSSVVYYLLKLDKWPFISSSMLVRETASSLSLKEKSSLLGGEWWSWMKVAAWVPDGSPHHISRWKLAPTISSNSLNQKGGLEMFVDRWTDRWMEGQVYLQDEGLVPYRVQSLDLDVSLVNSVQWHSIFYDRFRGLSPGLVCPTLIFILHYGQQAVRVTEAYSKHTEDQKAQLEMKNKMGPGWYQTVVASEHVFHSLLSFFHSVTVTDTCFLLIWYSCCNMSVLSDATTHLWPVIGAEVLLCEVPHDCTAPELLACFVGSAWCC